jgi:hypothetical protein
MQRYTALLLVLPLWLAAACGPDEAPDTADPAETDVAETAATEIDPVHQEFFANLSQLCGETLVGDGVYPDDPDHPLVDTGLRNYISECTDDLVRIELYRNGGEYWHGAWVLEKRPQGFHLFHDHLGEERTEEDLNGASHGYGGYANQDGTPTRQYFPADQVTAEMIPAAATNVWMMEMDLDAGTFVYSLERNQEPRFRAEMELVR